MLPVILQLIFCVPHAGQPTPLSIPYPSPDIYSRLMSPDQGWPCLLLLVRVDCQSLMYEMWKRSGPPRPEV